jgi:zona occludens toxin (predicted ATPase)
LFAEAAKKHGSPIGIIQDDREKPDKFSRIEGNLEPINRNGLLIFNEAERGNPNMLRLEEQFLLVNPRLSAPADGPDCIEGGKWIIDQKNATLAPDSIKIGYKTRNNKKSF